MIDVRDVVMLAVNYSLETFGTVQYPYSSALRNLTSSLRFLPSLRPYFSLFRVIIKDTISNTFPSSTIGITLL
jgi:hypothetical protein